MTKPDFSYELAYCDKYSLVAGVDEVGRGAFAGPVVAGACALKPHYWKDKGVIETILSLGINDSKLLHPKERSALAPEIKKYFYWGIGETDVSLINNLGIVAATQKAVRRAVKMLLLKTGSQSCFLLCDAFPIPYLKSIDQKRQLAIINGDQKCISVAAASVIAKVYRDQFMKKLAKHFRVYHWGKNKGYGTLSHRTIIKEHGITILHRKQFVETWLNHSL